jgi:membrane protease subunit (stomatin/prohibitin family)
MEGHSVGTDNLVFLEVIEWFDESGRCMVHRIPERGSGEIKFGAQLIVRDSQAGVLFYKGKACDAFGPGRHTLKTGNIPLLTKILSVPWGLTSPLRAEVYMVNMKVFANLKWGTREPVAFKDSELGLVRLRAHGICNIRILQPVLFINTLVGTMGRYETEEVEEYLRRVIVSRFNDYLGEKIDSLLNLPGRYDTFAVELKERIQKDFKHFGIGLTELFITSITPPPEVQQAIDDRSRLGVIQDLDGLIKMKAAMAMENASLSTGEAGSGIGMGLGLMMPAMFADVFRPASARGVAGGAAGGETKCAECDHPIPADARFCPHCGHQQLVLGQCVSCGKNIPPNARFCPKCGIPVGGKPAEISCPHCNAENLPGATFCNQCGERLG